MSIHEMVKDNKSNCNAFFSQNTLIFQFYNFASPPLTCCCFLNLAFNILSLSPLFFMGFRIMLLFYLFSNFQGGWNLLFFCVFFRIFFNFSAYVWGCSRMNGELLIRFYELVICTHIYFLKQNFC